MEDTAAGMNLPSLGQVARHAWPRLVEATIIPLLLIYVDL